MRHFESDEILDASQIDARPIYCKQVDTSNLKLGDRIYVHGGGLIGVFIVKRKVFEVFQEYKMQDDIKVIDCILLNKAGIVMPQGEEYCVLHFGKWYDCINDAKKPVTDGSPLSSFRQFYCFREKVPPFDFFKNIGGEMMSASLVERIRKEKFTNFEFDEMIVE
jgi:hypothetical protein